MLRQKFNCIIFAIICKLIVGNSSELVDSDLSHCAQFTIEHSSFEDYYDIDKFSDAGNDNFNIKLYMETDAIKVCIDLTSSDSNLAHVASYVICFSSEFEHTYIRRYPSDAINILVNTDRFLGINNRIFPIQIRFVNGTTIQVMVENEQTPLLQSTDAHPIAVKYISFQMPFEGRTKFYYACQNVSENGETKPDLPPNRFATELDRVIYNYHNCSHSLSIDSCTFLMFLIYFLFKSR